MSESRSKLTKSLSFLKRSFVAEWMVLTGLFLATLVMLYPLSLNPNEMVPEPADPLLNVWRMHWDKHSILSGVDSLRRLFDANIFYPYPMTLAYSEHFLMETALALPILLLADSHLLGMNLSVLLSFVLSAYGAYLLISDWTRNRWAGLFAGFLLAFAPYRYGHINHLELLVMHWMPLTLLSLHWLLTRTHRRYLVLFILFFNLQALSAINYTFHLALACVLLTMILWLAGRINWRRGLLIDLVLFSSITFVLNWPLWRIYLRFSELMNAERTIGEVRVYSAAFTDYLTTIPQNLLYGWTFGRWQLAGHQFQPLMPVGVVGLFLAIIGLVWSLRRVAQRRPDGIWGLFFAVLTLVAFLMSLGANDEAFGSAFAPVLSRVLPYPWLYKHVPGFKGIRVPARYAVLVTLGLTGLAGWGFAILQRFLRFRRKRTLSIVVPVVLSLLVILEYWSVPLAGPKFAYGEATPPVYHWLRQTPNDSVVLGLPYKGASEFAYGYFSTYHWRRLANGGSGYTPPAYRKLREWLKTFPDWRSIDVIQQLGVDYVVLHQPQSAPEDWEVILSQLPGYLSAFDEVHRVGESVVLHVAAPQCRADHASVNTSLSQEIEEQPGVAQLTLRNFGPATFIADVSRASHLRVNGQQVESFLEPLAILPNETHIMRLPFDANRGNGGLLEARLATLDRSLVSGESDETSPSTFAPNQSPDLQLTLYFQDGPQLTGFSLSPEEPHVCTVLEVALYWKESKSGNVAVVQLVDRFGRVVVESKSHFWDNEAGEVPQLYSLPLSGALPPGVYGLSVRVETAEGSYRAAVNDKGDIIPSDQLPMWPVIIRPFPMTAPGDMVPLATFADTVDLLDSSISHNAELKPGDWLRLTLTWRARGPVERDLTVFTQLIGPDGQVWGQQDNPPLGGWYPTPLWQPGEVVQDDFAFAIDSLAPAGNYQLIVGLYDSQTIERLPIRTTGSLDTDQVTVGHITVHPQ